MKDTYYFSHDYNTRTDVKIKRIIAKHGMLGYGVFWAIIEDLYNNANALPLDYESIAFDLRTDCDLIKSMINDFDLFIIDGELFGSLSVQRRIDERNEKSTKARDSANKRWNKLETNANALPTQSDSNAIKESKVNENKENKEILFESLWKNYPTKIGKQDALKKFLKLSDADLEKVKIHLPIFSKTKELEKYNHPHLSTYLNKKRFNDEISENIPQSERKLLRLPQEYENYMGMELGLLLSKIKQQKGTDYIPDLTKEKYNTLTYDSKQMYDKWISNGHCNLIEE